jgi:hypothetical protein
VWASKVIFHPFDAGAHGFGHERHFFSVQGQMGVQLSLLLVEQRYPTNGGHFEYGTDGASWVSSLNPLQQRTRDTCARSQVCGGQRFVQTGLTHKLPQQLKRTQVVLGIGTRDGFDQKFASLTSLLIDLCNINESFFHGLLAKSTVARAIHEEKNGVSWVRSANPSGFCCAYLSLK